MTVTAQRGAQDESVSTEPVIVVSCDSHIGPKLDDLRSYCPKEHLDDFDAYRKAHEDMLRARMQDNPAFFGASSATSDEAKKEADRFVFMYMRCQRTDGHHDMEARRRDMDRDGVAADVIYHGSVNFQPIPFVPGGEDFFFTPTTGDLPMAAVGLNIYNRWLADACATAPERHIGLAHIPIWDVAASVREVEQAAAAGLRGINFPVPRPGILPYDHPAWEPFWSVCAANGVTLNAHSGNGAIDTDPANSGPHMPVMVEIEVSGWVSRSALHRMVFSGVFERHPSLKLVLSEQNGDWWPTTMREYDSAYLAHRGQLADTLPRLPSDYCRTNVFIGGSFLAHYQAEEASAGGYAPNLMWGSDYPHPEGTWQYQEEGVDPPMTRLALRHTFAGVPVADTLRMVGENAIGVYGLDRSALQAIANRIGAPTLDELATPIDAIPEDCGFMAFRTVGPWA